MMTELVYQLDSYLREIEAKVLSLSGNALVVDRTIFHPRSGGVDCDTGHVFAPRGQARVKCAYFDRQTGDVVHELEGALEASPGETVRLAIDWDRRYRLMRLHTAAHIISAIMYRDYGALITGGNVGVDYAYDDYGLEKFDRSIFEDAVSKANEVVRKGLEVKVYWLPWEDAMKIPGIVKLASRAPPKAEKLRIVEIPGVDVQADGGPHVRNTSEIGVIELLKVENKGKNKKRLYFTVRP